METFYILDSIESKTGLISSWMEVPLEVPKNKAPDLKDIVDNAKSKQTK